MKAWFIFGCIVCVVNPLLGAIVLFPVMVIWVAGRLSK